MAQKATGRTPTARTALERQQKSRQATQNAYTRARNAAEREVVHLMIQKYASVYDELRTVVEAEVSDAHRAVRQSRTRSACAAWYRQTHRAKWDKLFDRHIAEVTAGTTTVIRRRKS